MILLTSKSPRRIALLKQVGFREKVHFEQALAAVNHDFRALEPLSLEQLLQEVVAAARKKVEYSVNQLRHLDAFDLPPEETVVVGADTVAFCEGHVLDRPMAADPLHARLAQVRAGERKACQTLEALSGKVIQVVTGLAVACGDDLGKWRSCPVVTEARMRTLAAEEIRRYVATGEPLDKAGAFGIQERGVALFEEIRGSYSNVVGLPLVEFWELLQDEMFRGRVQLPAGEVFAAAEPALEEAVPELSVVAMGDVSYELLYDREAGSPVVPEREPERHEQGRLRCGVGGSAVRFATCAHQAGFTRCSVLGVIGGDPLGQSILQELHEKGIHSLLPQDFDRQTSIALAVRQEGRAEPFWTLTDSRQALSKDQVEQAKSEIRRAHVLYVSGYCLQDPERRQAALHAMELAREAGSLVVLNLRPGVAMDLPLGHLRALITDRWGEQARFDVLAAEIPAVLAWLGHEAAGPGEPGLLEATVLPALHEVFATVFLRAADFSREVISSPAGISHRVLGAEEQAGRGYPLTARHLYQYMSPRLLLASASPRRLELLRQIVAPNKIEVRVSRHEEEFRPGEAPAARVERLALEKAQRVLAAGEFSKSIEIVLGADTEVVVETDGGGLEVVPHPRDEATARQTLRRLSGRSQQVITGLALLQVPDKGLGQPRQVVEHVTTRVQIRQLTPTEIDWYVATGEPLGKAGGYGIQGCGALLVAGLEGSYSNVVGLPLERLCRILEEDFAMPIWDVDKVSSWRLPRTNGGTP